MKMKINSYVFFLWFFSVVFCIVNYMCIPADALCVLCYFLLILYFFTKKPHLVMKYLFFFISSTWSVIAVYICENIKGIYIGGKPSEYYGSLAPYVFGWFIFYITLLINENKSLHTNKNKVLMHETDCQTKAISKWIIYILIALAIIIFLLVIRHPAFLLGVNRFYIRDNVQSSFSRNLYRYAISVIPILVFDRKNHKYAWIIYVSLLCLYNLWIGEKFGGFLMIIYYIILGILPTGYETVEGTLKRNLKRIIIIALAAVFALLGVVRFQRYVANPDEDFTKYLSQRIASQAWVWWNTYGGDSGNGFHINEIGDELQVMINEPTGNMSEYNFGIYKLMKKFCNYENKADNLLDARVRGAESGRADFYYYLKIPGLILGQMIFAHIFFKVIGSAIIAMKKRKVLLSFFYVQILRYLINAFIQSDFYLLSTFTAGVCYIGIIALSRGITVKGKSINTGNQRRLINEGTNS